MSLLESLATLVVRAIAVAIVTLMAQHAIRVFRELHNPSLQLARRFRKVFRAHSIADSEIPSRVPWDWNLDTVKDDATLIQSIGQDQIDWMIATFGIRRQWLEAGDSQIYDPIWGYKEPERLIHQLESLGMLNVHAKVTAFVDEQHLQHGQIDRAANPLLVFSSTIDTEMEDAPTKYVVCGDDWFWRHWPCRRDVKAIARYMFRDHVATIPIVPVSSKVLAELREGKSFPGAFIPTCRGSLSRLEDYALTDTESQIAKEADEANAVVNYFDEQFGRLGISRSKTLPSMIFGRT